MRYREYSNWIWSVREKKHLDQDEFALKILKDKKDDFSWGVHRNSISNWENGENLPSGYDVFISIAMMEYEQNLDEVWENAKIEERNARYKAVMDKMEQFLGRKLYCRNINDVLWIQVIRGIYSISQLPEVRRKMNKMISEGPLSLEEKQKVSMKKFTGFLEAELMEVKSQEEMESLVYKYRKYFQVGNRVVGERMKSRYRESGREEEITFPKAVLIYAPKYQNSFKKMSTSDFFPSRDWILDFCIKMRFDREDINLALKDASMVPLSEQDRSEEYYIRSNAEVKVGSVAWYQKNAIQCSKHYKIRYEEVESLTLEKKITFLMLVIWSLDRNPDSLMSIPVDYLLDYFLGQKEGILLLEQVSALEDRYDDVKLEEQRDLWTKQFETICGVHIKQRLRRYEELDVYEEYCNEFRRYYEIPQARFQFGLSPNLHCKANVLRFFAAISYSVFTGELYMGELPRGNEEMFKALLKENSQIKELLQNAFNFIKFMWGLFLDNGARNMAVDQEGFYHLNTGKGKRSKSLNLDKVLELMLETWRLFET